MAIRFKCTNPSCGRPIEAPDSAGGKKARCPKCGIVLSIPAAGDLFPSVDDVPRPPAAAPRATAAPRMLAGSPPRPQKPKNARPLVIAGIALLAITVVVVVILMATKTDSPKPASPVASPELPAAEEPSKPQLPVVAVAPAAAPAKAPPAAVPAATTEPAKSSTPIAKVTPISTAPSAPPAAGTNQGEGTAVVTPGGTLTVINTPTEYAGALLGARALGQRAKSLENMKLVRDSLLAYTMEADKFPADWTELTSKGGMNADAIKSPGDPKKNFVLVGGQTPSSKKTNILAYDPFPYRRTDIVIIEVDGPPKFISLDDLKKRLAEQGAKPNEIPE